MSSEAASAEHQVRRKQREPTLVFLAKAMVLSITLFAAAFVLMSMVRVSYDTQQNTSLPYRLWVTLAFDDSVQAGNYVAFRTGPKAKRFFEPGTRFVKKVAAGPGDHVVVHSGTVRINGQVVADLPLAPALDKPLAAFNRDLVISTGHYWVMGTDPRSYDSRYWGTISADRIIGQSYPLW